MNSTAPKVKTPQEMWLELPDNVVGEIIKGELQFLIGSARCYPQAWQQLIALEKCLFMPSKVLKTFGW
jgi:hypothetical protein